MTNRIFWSSMTVGLTAALALPLPGLSASRSERIEQAERKIERKRSHEARLSEAIAGFSVRIRRLQGQVNGFQARRERLQAKLDAKQAELEEVRERLDAARERLAQLRLELRVAEAKLADRLVELYKADEPDALTVVLEADGFADLLERTDFLERVSEQDQRIITKVRVLKRRAEEQERRLAALEERVEAVADAILARRNEVAAAQREVERARDELARSRAGRAATLAAVRGDRRRLEDHVDDLRAEEAQVQRTLAAPGLSGGAPRQGSGGLIWPVNGPITSGFGQRWGRLHAGVDIGAPSGTPIRAAQAGNVVIASPTGGYGNYVCIQHSSISTCYAHLSAFATSAGASVSQGQLIGYVGCTGNCFGDHLHFEVRIGGSPVDPMGYL